MAISRCVSSSGDLSIVDVKGDFCGELPETEPLVGGVGSDDEKGFPISGLECSE